MPLSPLAYRMRQMTQRDGLLPRGARVVVGVSGGPDSVALLSLLAELRPVDQLTLWGLYVNHGWRPGAARREAAFVRRLGRQLRVPIRVVAIAPRKQPRRSWEGTARQARYAALARLARRVRATAVAVGHTQEDQAETVLLALLRGSGLQGAGAMAVARSLNGSSATLIRPLLGLRHAELKQYLRQRRLPWVVDATNHDPRFRRNRLRRAVLPVLARQYGPQIVERLAAFAELARADEAWLQAQAVRWGRRYARRRGGVVRFPVRALLRQPVALQRRVVRWAVGRAAAAPPGLTFRHVAAVLALLEHRAGEVHLPQGLVAVVGRGACTLRRRSRPR